MRDGWVFLSLIPLLEVSLWHRGDDPHNLSALRDPVPAPGAHCCPGAGAIIDPAGQSSGCPAVRCPGNTLPLQPVLFPLSLCCSDSCKFLHDRSDYKHGWQIERELDEGRYGINGTAPLPLCCRAVQLLLQEELRARSHRVQSRAAAFSQPLALCEGQSSAVRVLAASCVELGPSVPQGPRSWDGICHSGHSCGPRLVRASVQMEAVLCSLGARAWWQLVWKKV